VTIVAAPTAVPLLVGYTERAPQFGVPVLITSIDDFASQFGGAAAGTVFYLEHLVRLFFFNGGTSTYILSLGPFGEVKAGDFRDALSALTQQTDVTLLAMPDAVLLPPADFMALTNDILDACAATERVFALLDLPPHETVGELNDVVAAFRAGLTSAGRRYGAAYAPWLVSSTASANIVPPAALMAAVYSVVDAESGVWRAPANYPLIAIAEPQVIINDAEQATLNVDAATGISIDAIRLFAGKGVLVWGARTLDGNNSDWRYVNAQRTGMMISASIRNALPAYVFMPNNAMTWAAVAANVNAFLTSLWQQGALQGMTAQTAFNVTVGREPEIESETMVVTVLVAIVRPSEFVVLRFEQAMPV
jgi:phage tail sheath protein FI